MSCVGVWLAMTAANPACSIPMTWSSATSARRVQGPGVPSLQRSSGDQPGAREVPNAVSLDDPYQRCEGKYRLTRGIIEALSQAANPFSILTKSTLVLGDLDRLAEAARRTEVRVNLSIGILDEEVWRHSEPGTLHPASGWQRWPESTRLAFPPGC